MSDPIRAHVESCTACSLHKTCDPVAWAGPQPASALIVESSRAESSGPALALREAILGPLLTGYSVASVVACTPPGNREPTLAEAAACRPNLALQIAHLAPRFVLVLGSPALSSLRPGEDMGKWRSRIWKRDGRFYLATWGARLVLTQPSRLNEWRSDLELFGALVNAWATFEVEPETCQACGDPVAVRTYDGTPWCRKGRH